MKSDPFCNANATASTRTATSATANAAFTIANTAIVTTSSFSTANDHNNDATGGGDIQGQSE